MTSSTTVRPGTWRDDPDDGNDPEQGDDWVAEHDDKWDPGQEDDRWGAEHGDGAWAEDSAEQTTVIPQSDSTTVISGSGLGDHDPEADEDDPAPAAVWADSGAESDERHVRGIRVGNYTVRPWQMAATGAAALLVIVVAAILGSAGGDGDSRSPTPQPAITQAPDDHADSDATDADTAPGSADSKPPAPADAPPVDPAHDPALSDPPPVAPAHDPALSDPPPPDPDDSAPLPPAAPVPSANNALPQGPLPANQLPGGPPLPYYGADGSPMSAPQPNEMRQSPNAESPMPPTRAYSPPPRYDSGRVEPRHRDRDSISHRLGSVTGLSRDSDDYDRGYGRPDDRDGYPDDRYDSYDRGGYDRDGYDRGPYDRGGYDRRPYDRGGYDRRPYDRDSGGLLGGL